MEVLGSYNPQSKQAALKEDRIKYWVSQGVQVSDTAYNLFLKQGIISGEKRKVKIPAKKVEEAAAEAPIAAKPEEKKEEAPKAEVAAPVAETKKPARSASPSDAGGEEKPEEKEDPKRENKPVEEAPKAE